jgi:outer membrane protein TolC
LLSELKTLNGGAAIDGISPKLMQPLEVTTLDVLWQEKLTSDPMLQELQASEAASLQQVKFEKRKVLPNIEVGYNYQGVTGSTFSGIYGGLSIPLWSSKNKVKAAEANS